MTEKEYNYLNQNKWFVLFPVLNAAIQQIKQMKDENKHILEYSSMNEKKDEYRPSITLSIFNFQKMIK